MVKGVNGGVNEGVVKGVNEGVKVTGSMLSLAKYTLVPLSG